MIEIIIGIGFLYSFFTICEHITEKCNNLRDVQREVDNMKQTIEKLENEVFNLKYKNYINDELENSYDEE